MLNYGSLNESRVSNKVTTFYSNFIRGSKESGHPLIGHPGENRMGGSYSSPNGMTRIDPVDSSLSSPSLSVFCHT